MIEDNGAFVKGSEYAFARTSAACSCCRASGFDSGQRSTEQ